MIDEAILERYMDESSAKMKESSRKHIQANIRQLFNAKPNVPIEDMKRQDFLDVFSNQSILTSNTFYPYKSKMVDFLIWMNEEGYCSQTPLKELQGIRYEDISRSGYYDMYYFSDYNDLAQTMDVILEECGEEYNTFKVAATMVWAGIQLDDAVNVLKSEFDEQTGTITHDGKTTQFPPLAASLIADYKASESYEARRCGGVIVNYCNTRYLLRSITKPQLDKHGLSHYAVVANKYTEGYDKKFKWISIYLSGLYYRIYQYEQEHGTIGRTNYDVLKQFFMPDVEDITKVRYKLCVKYDEYCEFRDHVYA